ncbi:acylamino-acid-releasing enzyme isoform X3 [Ziziphus jujuba]|uniref:Acylamino-acid-releasing enzyme n=1 Tax=Ziziphus jujuba TaxID=326968 RepID=A0ABM3IRF3_ZIZJJ|nr:acylamino-acid-releasing enzyme isoform X3 [Ziziphus jujuba]
MTSTPNAHQMGRVLLCSANSNWCVNFLRSRFPSPYLSHPLSSFTLPLRRLHSLSILLGAEKLISDQRINCKLAEARKKNFKPLAMEGSKAGSVKELPLGIDVTTEEEYTLQSKLLKEFTSISSIDKAWIFKSDSGINSQALFSISQANLLANKRRKFILSGQISKESNASVNFQWAPFPVEMTGASIIVPSPSGAKLLVVRNSENESPSQIEIWGPSQLEKEFHVPQSIHGSIYTDGWFEGISWNHNETIIAYVAEEPSPTKPTFGNLGYKKGDGTDKDMNSWKGQGDWEEDWGETYAGKRQPALFVIDINSGEVRAVKGIEKSLSVGQVVWAPSVEGSHRYLVFVGWSPDKRKLGIKYCYNRSCALYSVRAPSFESEANTHDLKDGSTEDMPVVNLTQSISSAFFPRFSPDGKFLVFLSAKSSVDSGAHSSTNSLHKIEWPLDGKVSSSVKIVDVIPVVLSAEDGFFPGLYCSSFLSNPWLSDGRTMILSSAWGSRQVILSVNVLSAEVLRISPVDSDSSWNVLTLDGDNVVAVSSSPVDIPEVKYGYLVDKATKNAVWNWLNVSSPIFRSSEKVRSLLSTLQFSILKIPVKDVSDSRTKGAKKPFEAIFVSSKTKRNDGFDPLIVVLHGGPHSVSLSSFSKPLAFLSSIGYNLLIVNYRGSLGFGEEALQSLPGKVGSQDVNDVLTAIDHVIEAGHASPSKITVLGGSHGGFLTTHLIGQAPDKFAAAAVRNPVCNLALMVGTTDIPDWCYVETYGSEGKKIFTEAPSAEQLTFFHSKSPISHISKVKAPTIFLLGAQDLRVPVSNGLQYSRALKERGVDVKVILFPNDVHGIERPQSDFESFLNIGVWFKKYCK